MKSEKSRSTHYELHSPLVPDSVPTAKPNSVQDLFPAKYTAPSESNYEEFLPEIAE